MLVSVSAGGWRCHMRASLSLHWGDSVGRMDICSKTLCSRRLTSLCSTRATASAESPGKGPRWGQKKKVFSFSTSPASQESVTVTFWSLLNTWIKTLSGTFYSMRQTSALTYCKVRTFCDQWSWELLTLTSEMKDTCNCTTVKWSADSQRQEVVGGKEGWWSREHTCQERRGYTDETGRGIQRIYPTEKSNTHLLFCTFCVCSQQIFGKQNNMLRYHVW